MKTLHVVSRFYPDEGGSEKFVGGLIEGLTALGVRCRVVSFGDSPAELTWRGTPIDRLQLSQYAGGDFEEYTCFGDREIASCFGAILDARSPDVVHLHARTREIALELACEVSRRGIPAVFTYHHPAATCLRKDLMRWNNRTCDGRLDERRCTACELHARGVPKPAAVIVAALPSSSSALASLTAGRVRSALLTGPRTRILHAQIRKFLAEFAHCISLASWSRDLLVRNGVSPERITVVRPGVESEAEKHAAPVQTPERLSGSRRPLRLAFLGRIDSTKGIDVVVRAMGSPTSDATLDIHGVMVDAGSGGYLRELQRIARGNPLIRFRDPLASERVIESLRSYDALLVPSVLMETGPLVVYEAFAAGIPVIGSDIGAINEVVKDRVNGRLLPAGDVHAWRAALRDLAENPQALFELRKGIPSLRTMTDVARETLFVYRRVAPEASVDDAGPLETRRA